MEVQDDKKIVLAKPVASRPSCSYFKSFSELLAGAINASPPRTHSETKLPIRPKTMQLRSSVNQMSVGAIPSQVQDEISGTAVCHSSQKVSLPERESNVIYKPLAKLVSKATVSLMANLGNANICNQNVCSSQVDHVLVPDQRKHQTENKLSSNLQEKFPLQKEPTEIPEPSKLASHNLEQYQRSLLATSSGDRISYDGYNWRKYGQKQVKGSEFPRSYYKCTNPNCPVKKKVERSLDGKITEIVYRGEHNHPKPQPPKRLSSGISSDGTERESLSPFCSNLINERNDGIESRVESQNEMPQLANAGKAALPRDAVAATALSTGVGTPDNSCGASGDCEGSGKQADGNDDEYICKRRKIDDRGNVIGPVTQSVQEPHISVQTSAEAEILPDGFRWRKYGQKIVKGNAYPRSYYRCTSLKCNVRKYVERASDDPRAFITTYEGKHNHDKPASKSLNPAASDSDSLAPSSKSKPLFDP